MFESKFKSEVLNITSDKTIADTLWSEIQMNYSTPERYYHTLIHLDNLVDELWELHKEISDWQTIIFSIAYHDIVYDPLKTNNEEKSAELAFERLGIVGLPVNQKKKCKDQVIATKKHDLSTDMDTNYFTDSDLAVLGSEPGLYKEYALAIRNEYRVYPDSVYNPGRQKVLEHFLQMPGIYKTKYFEQKYETMARKNLTGELQQLSSR